LAYEVQDLTYYDLEMTHKCIFLPPREVLGLNFGGLHILSQIIMRLASVLELRVLYLVKVLLEIVYLVSCRKFNKM